MIPTPSAQLVDEVDPFDGSPRKVVQVTWTAAPGFPALDRPDVGGFVLGGTSGRYIELGNRMVRAVNAGAVYVNASVAIDVNGQTYASARSRVMCKYMNADLKKLGY